MPSHAAQRTILYEVTVFGSLQLRNHLMTGGRIVSESQVRPGALIGPLHGGTYQEVVRRRCHRMAQIKRAQSAGLGTPDMGAIGSP